MTKEESEKYIKSKMCNNCSVHLGGGKCSDNCKVIEAIKALEQEPKTGQWIRMSDLSEQEDDRYKCSHCGNVVHHKNKINLYTFNSWCGRCGSNNGKIEVDI